MEVMKLDANLARQCRPWFRSALIFFILASAIGVVMRYAFVGNLPSYISFTNIRHAHSHVSLLGWLYAGLYIFIVLLFDLTRRTYKRLFWITQATVLGMLISFPLQGYGGFSIVFVTLYIFLSYYFIVLVWKDLRNIPTDQSIIFLKTALVFLFISSLGTWLLSFLMNTSLKGSALYYAAIQFYLHFQFNGWLIFGVLALFFRWLSINQIDTDQSRMILLFRLLFVSTILTYAIAVTWSTPLPFIFLINSIGVVIQFAALIILLRIVYKIMIPFRKVITNEIYVLLAIALLSLIIKIVIQAMVVIPSIAIISYTIRNFIVGFIHLLMLGCISLKFIALSHHFMQLNTRLSKGMKIFVAGVVLSEILLFVQGLMIWFKLGFMQYYHHSMLILSALMPLGVIIYFIRTNKEVTLSHELSSDHSKV